MSRFLPGRRPSAPMTGHHPSPSTSSFGPQSGSSNYAPSVYAQSTLAASTVMPQMMVQPVHDDERTKWIEGHCLQRCHTDASSTCSICDERCQDESFKCLGKLKLVMQDRQRPTANIPRLWDNGPLPMP